MMLKGPVKKVGFYILGYFFEEMVEDGIKSSDEGEAVVTSLVEDASMLVSLDMYKLLKIAGCTVAIGAVSVVSYYGIRKKPWKKWFKKRKPKNLPPPPMGLDRRDSFYISEDLLSWAANILDYTTKELQIRASPDVLVKVVEHLQRCPCSLYCSRLKPKEDFGLGTVQICSKCKPMKKYETPLTAPKGTFARIFPKKKPKIWEDKSTGQLWRESQIDNDYYEIYANLQDLEQGRRIRAPNACESDEKGFWKIQIFGILPECCQLESNDTL
eukprot:TRINITY_DN11702_c0_g1_i1.p1 TRINITY_DN11702_c0_g1~~TRINITY_DN11702_c0_g1_i1.p1  ORF type:complete len:270 (+),score=42.09 TRINITY_DN11702_c0_g1_i1:119-928(+)